MIHNLIQNTGKEMEFHFFLDFSLRSVLLNRFRVMTVTVMLYYLFLSGG